MIDFVLPHPASTWDRKKCKIAFLHGIIASQGQGTSLSISAAQEGSSWRLFSPALLSQIQLAAGGEPILLPAPGHGQGTENSSTGTNASTPGSCQHPPRSWGCQDKCQNQSRLRVLHSVHWMEIKYFNCAFFPQKISSACCYTQTELAILRCYIFKTYLWPFYFCPIVRCWEAQGITLRPSALCQFATTETEKQWPQIDKMFHVGKLEFCLSSPLPGLISLHTVHVSCQAWAVSG